MNQGTRFITATAPFFIGMWSATQKIANYCEYDPMLGEPIIKFCHLYAPWQWFVWYGKFHQYIPDLFRSSLIPLAIGGVVSLALMMFLRPPEKRDSHGTAHWAEYNDLRKMELFNKHGVVVGLYDDKLANGFFIKKCTEILRWIESKKNETGSDFYKKIYKNFLGFYASLNHYYLHDNSNKHLAVVAPTRSGKGVGLIIPTLLGGWTESCIINDIKSENWGVTAGYRKKMGQTVIKFEPTATDGSTARWNPLNEIPIGTEEEVSASQNLAYVIVDYEGKGKLDFWGASAAVVIQAVILHLKYAHFADPEHYPFEPNLYTVAAFMKANVIPAFDKDGNPIIDEETGEQAMTVADFIATLQQLIEFPHVPDEGLHIREWDTKKCEYVERVMFPKDLQELYPFESSLMHMPNTHPIIFKCFSEIIKKPPNECGSIISTANTALKEYLDPVLAKNTSISDFCVDDLMNYQKPVSLYLVTPPSDLLRLAPIFRLFFEMMVRHHAKKIGDYVNGQAVTVYKHKCLFLMDEFSSLGNLLSFAATLSYIAGYGMKVFLICQGIPQINGIYGKDNQILMNCHLQIFYAPNDNDSGKYAESLLGNETRVNKSISDAGGFFGKRTYSYSEAARALMTADEIKRLGEQEIISASGFPPVKTDKVKYYENEFFRSKLMDAPYVSDVIRNNPYPLRDKRIAEHKAGAKPADHSFKFAFDESAGAKKSLKPKKSNFTFEYSDKGAGKNV